VQAAQLVAQLQEEYQIQIPIRQLFYDPTVRVVAEYIDGQLHSDEELDNESRNRGNLVLLRSGDKDKNVFFIHGGIGESVTFIDWCKRLDKKYRCWGLSSKYHNNIAPQTRLMEVIIHPYMNDIRSVQKTGPYTLIGWSAGGVIAYAAAEQLELEGEVVDKLILLDSMEPGKYDIGGTKAVQEYKAEDEIEIIHSYLQDEKLISRLKSEKTVEGIWTSLKYILENNEEKYREFKETIKDQFPFIADSIVEYDYESVEALMLYINRFRSFVNTLIRYSPKGKIAVNVNLICADESTVSIDINEWNKYLHKPAASKKIAGNHFNILYPPYVDDLAKYVNGILDGFY